MFVTSLIYFLSLPLSTSVIDRNAIVTPSHRTDLASPKDGFVKEVFVREGEFVKKGELLLKVESIEDQKALRENQFEVLSLDKQLSVAWTEAQITTLKLEEAIRLKKLGSIKESVLTEAFLHSQVSQRKVEALIFKLEQARVKQTFLEKIRKEEAIRAPFNALVISDTRLKEKSFVKQGEFLITLASQKSLVEFLLKEGDYSRVSIGAKAKIKFYAFPEKTYEGRIVSFKHFAEPIPKSGIPKHAVKVLIQCDEMPKEIQNGMSAKVVIEAKSKSVLGRIYHELL